jgi:hypothetical protein
MAAFLCLPGPKKSFHAILQTAGIAGIMLKEEIAVKLLEWGNSVRVYGIAFKSL